MNLKSSNVGMLYGIIDACNHIKGSNAKIYLIVPTELGFQKALKQKGVNFSLIKEILDLCDSKHLLLFPITFLNGGKYIKQLVSQKSELFPGDPICSVNFPLK